MSFTHLPAQCPRCRSVLRVRRELLGQSVCCVYCNQVFEAGRRANARTSAAPRDEPEETGAAKPVWLLGAGRSADVPSRPEVAEPKSKPAAAATAPPLAEVEALRADLDRARAEAEALAARLIVAREELARLREALARERDATRAEDQARRLPVLVRDLQRWSELTAKDLRPSAVAIAVAVGPPPLPPSLDDIAAVERHADLLRELMRTPLATGRPFHTLFDPDRFQVLQARLRESALLADRLINNVERSRNQKEVMWHLMVAQRTDELNRKRR